MTRILPRLGLTAALVCAGAVLLSQTAQAQLIAGPGVGRKPQAPKPAAPPPPALPGAQSDNSRVTPSDRPATDLPPTEALFDAINRGDLSAAKDAISRGADLNGQNMLGMSPMELSVDLGRNDITFLLLSERGAEAAQARARPAAKGAQVAVEQKKPTSRRPERVARAPAPAPVRAASPAAGQNPRLFAGDGGAPVPSAGFLGFDAGRNGAAR